MKENRGTILYVEDNPDNRRLISRVLTVEGFVVQEASDAKDALNLLQSMRPDIILMDINMPDMDGYTLTAKIRELPNLGSIPVIALTANVMKGDRERSIEAGCDGYIQKPVDIDTLAQQVERFLKR
jgi:two-component system, cell cycle response regulator DivK